MNKSYFAIIAFIALALLVRFVEMSFNQAPPAAPETEERLSCPNIRDGIALSRMTFNADDSLTCNYGSQAYKYFKKDARYEKTLAECRSNSNIAVELAVKKGAMRVEGFDPAMLFETTKAICMRDNGY